MQCSRLNGIVGREFAPKEECRGFDPQLGEVKDWKIGTCCFSG